MNDKVFLDTVCDALDFHLAGRSKTISYKRMAGARRPFIKKNLRGSPDTVPLLRIPCPGKR
jgi:hypothetical protein